MANLCPFRALRPRPVDAARIAAVPYDVLDTEEARALAEGNSLSFLRVSRAEIECEPGTDPHAAEVYERARGNFAALRQSALVIEEMPSLYLYRLGMGGHEQIGVAACFALDDYDNDVIKKHEWTRRDKEDDRTRHMLSLGAQTGPVFLIYRARAEINRLVAAAATAEPFIDFEAIDGVRHTLWRLEDCDCDALIKATARIPFLYIADGHHRAASAARARTELQKRAGSRMPFDSIADYRTFLAVAFPDHQVQILPYNRVVRDLAGLSADEFLLAIGARFEVSSGPAMPVRRGRHRDVRSRHVVHAEVAGHFRGSRSWSSYGC